MIDGADICLRLVSACLALLFRGFNLLFYSFMRGIAFIACFTYARVFACVMCVVHLCMCCFCVVCTYVDNEYLCLHVAVDWNSMHVCRL